MMGDEDKGRPGAGTIEEHPALEDGRASEIPTDPSCPSRAILEGVKSASAHEISERISHNDPPPGTRDTMDARPPPDADTDPSQPSHPRLPQHNSGPHGVAPHGSAPHAPATHAPISPALAAHAPISHVSSHPSVSQASLSGASKSLRASGAISVSRDGRPSTSVDRAPRRSGNSGKDSVAHLKTELEAANTPEPAPPPDVKDEHVGKIFGGKYRIDKLIAKGGMGRVYRGTQFPLERNVAIKILNKEFQRTDPQFVRRFILEASTAAKLSHPHTITVFDYGESDSGELFIAMEYLKGRPLSRVISHDGPFAADRALRIGIQVARAVREAHLIGIIHRDLKPGNIFLVEDGDEGDYAKVLDFGLVKLFRPGEESGKETSGMLGEGDPELTRTGTLLGSPKYMSPEQIQGQHLDPRTDIYSFGVILFQMIAGKPPFSGATGVDVIYKHVHAPLPAIAEIAPSVECPRAVEDLIQRCLSKKRDDRYASMDELIVHLKEALRLITGATTSVDSIAEADSVLRSDSIRPRPAPSNPGMEKVNSRREKPASGPAMPAMPAIPNSPTNPSLVGSEPSVREVRFRDQLVEETTPVGVISERSSAQRPPQVKPSRLPLWLGLMGVLLVVSIVGWVAIAPRFSHENPKPNVEPTAAARIADKDSHPQTPPPPKEIEVRFTSTPSGARVFEGANELGVTPFAKKVALGLHADEPRELVFRYPGYKDEVKTVLFDEKLSAVDAILAKETAAAAAEDDSDAHDDKRPATVRKKKVVVPAKTIKKDQGPYRQNPY